MSAIGLPTIEILDESDLLALTHFQRASPKQILSFCICAVTVSYEGQALVDSCRKFISSLVSGNSNGSLLGAWNAFHLNATFWEARLPVQSCAMVCGGCVCVCVCVCGRGGGAMAMPHHIFRVFGCQHGRQ